MRHGARAAASGRHAQRDTQPRHHLAEEAGVKSWRVTRGRRDLHPVIRTSQHALHGLSVHSLLQFGAQHLGGTRSRHDDCTTALCPS